MRNTILALMICLFATIGANAQCLSGRFGSTSPLLILSDTSRIFQQTWAKFDDNFTIQTWAKFDSAQPKMQTILSVRNNWLGSPIGLIDSISIMNDHGKITANLGTSVFLTSDTLSDTSWMHIEVVRDTHNLRAYLFVNGILRDTTLCPNTPLLNIVSGAYPGLQIGQKFWSPGYSAYKLFGYINAVKITPYAENTTDFIPECLLSDTLPHETLLYINFNGKLPSSYDSSGWLRKTLCYSGYPLDSNASCLPCDTVTTIDSSWLSIKSIERSDIQVYPNPTSDMFTVTLPTYTPTSAVINDMLGKLVRQVTISKTTEIEGLPAGIYILSISGQKFKLIKQ